MAKDLSAPIGSRFGRLLVIKHDHSKRYRFCTHHHYLCACDCGSKKVVSLAHLRAGKIASCGCLRREATVIRETIHGHTGKAHPKGTRTFQIWSGMWKRCTNPRDRNYPRYGGRGIRVCDRWKEFLNFLADMGEIPAPLSLDRIDVDGHYTPGNCRLATHAEQARNRRRYTLEGAPEKLLAPPKRARRPHERHGYSRTRIYRVWVAMRDRCMNPKNPHFADYGGRGIRVCGRWSLFSAFLADMGEPPPGLWLDRIDVHGNYEPSNCRWATPKVQVLNRRKRIYSQAQQLSTVTNQ